MFGYLRLTLALMVVFSHIGVRLYSLNIGVIAVVVFYILAGYVSAHLLGDIFTSKKEFYTDRVKRIFPLYFYTLSLTLLFLLLTSYAQPEFAPLKLLYNLTVIPLNYYMYIDTTILKDPSWWLIPPAWSLATELQAYLLLPFVLKSKKVFFITASLSFIVYMLANFSLLNPDYFAYRFIVGVFFIFLLGVALQLYTNAHKLYLSIVYASILLFGIYFFISNSFSTAYTKETFIGILFGVPLLLFVKKTTKKFPFNRQLGALSYVVFLTHFLSIWVLKYLHTSPDNTLVYTTKLLSLTLLFAIFGLILDTKLYSRYIKDSK